VPSATNEEYELLVMPGLDPGIHVLRVALNEDVDGRVKPGHDEACLWSGTVP
jgi:hypothetical protein